MSESHTQEFAYRRLGAAIIERALKDLTLSKLYHSGHSRQCERSRLFQDTLDWFNSSDESIGSYRWALSLTYVSPNSIRKYINEIIKKQKEEADVARV